MTDSWQEVKEWRQAQRTRLLAARQALTRKAKSACTWAVTRALADQGPALEGARIGFYWPVKGEVDLVGFVRGALRIATSAALPVVVKRHQPLEFWRWTLTTELCNRGIWTIPSPAERVVVEPNLLFVPLLGFDEAGYRLGYGSGYYDRTLAALNPRPLAVGIGHDLSRLKTIHPQAHDIPMDMIVTESGIVRFK